MGSFTNINTYAQESVAFTDLRDPGPRLFPPVARGQVFEFDQGIDDPYLIPMAVEIEEIVRAEDADIFLYINTQLVPDAIVEWQSLPTGVLFTQLNSVLYSVGPINTMAQWDQIKTNGFITFPSNTEGLALYNVSLEWFTGSEFKSITWPVGTFIPVALIKGQFTVAIDPTYIYAPHYDLFANFEFYNLSGKLFEIDETYSSQFSVTTIKNRLRGISFARSAVFTLNNQNVSSV